MKFVTNIDQQTFDTFVGQHSKNHFLQTATWGAFKGMSAEWSFDTVGLVNDQNELQAAALVLIRQLPFIKRNFMYIPRGFVLDFYNESLLKTFTQEFAAYAKRNNAIFFKLDPDLQFVKRDVDGQRLEDAVDQMPLIETLTSLGYQHLGFTTDFDSSIQPRYTFRLDLTQSEQELLKGAHSKTRYNLKVAQKKGIEIVEGTREDLQTFEAIMRVTGERDGFLTRPLSYFEQMYDTLHKENMCKLYLARLNTQTALESMTAELEQTQALVSQYEAQLQDDTLADKKRQKMMNKLTPEQNKLTNLTQQVELMTDLYKKHPDGITMSGIITTYFGNKAWYLYGASDNMYREFMPNYLIQWHALTEAKKMGYEIYDFFGISGRTDAADPLHGLYRFKKGFGGEYTEFLGEFDYVVSPFWYFAWTKALPQFKNFKKRLRAKKTGSHAE